MRSGEPNVELWWETRTLCVKSRETGAKTWEMARYIYLWGARKSLAITHS